MTDRRGTNPTVVELPDHVVARIEAQVSQTEFDSIDDYAATALDLVLQQVATAERTDGDAASPPDERTNVAEVADSAAVEEQLESLGYL